MNIQEWFDSGCNYQQGVMLYGSLKGHRSNLLRIFLKSESEKNLGKLKYELEKLNVRYGGSESDDQVQVIHRSKTKTAIDSVVPPLVPSDKKYERPPSGMFFYRLNELHIDLHPLSRKQRDDFQKAVSLKLQLNDIDPLDDTAALPLCIEIENLFDAVDQAQKVLKHYVDHKVVLKLNTKDFKNLTPAQLVQARNNKRASVSKYERKIKELEASVSGDLTKAEKTKVQVSLQRASEKLLQHESELQKLNELINSK